MANPQHLAWLKEGVAAWNARRQRDDFLADLSTANVGGMDLRRANLVGADLAGANLGGTDLRGADLRGANLGGAFLGGADLVGATLGGAFFGGANLGGTDVRSYDDKDGHIVYSGAGASHGSAPRYATDLSTARNLTQPQLNSLRGDRWTKIPDHLKNPWLDDKSGGPEPDVGAGSQTIQETVGNPDVAEARRRIDDNRDAIMLLATDLKIKIGAYRDRVRVSNSLGEEAKLGLHGMLEELTHDVDAIAHNLPAPGEATTEAQAEVVLTRGQRAIKRLEQNLNEYFGLENLMDAAVPIGIILGFSVMGGLVAGAVGFGAGGLVGKLVVKHLKPGDAMDEASEL